MLLLFVHGLKFGLLFEASFISRAVMRRRVSAWFVHTCGPGVTFINNVIMLQAC